MMWLCPVTCVVQEISELVKYIISRTRLQIYSFKCVVCLGIDIHCKKARGSSNVMFVFVLPTHMPFGGCLNLEFVPWANNLYCIDLMGLLHPIT